MLQINKKFQSPNFSLRPASMKIDSIVIHYTDMKDDVSALNRLCDPKTEVSSHYLVSKTGEIFSLVDDHLRAWHAGESCWMGQEKVNDYSIGIELDNNGNEIFNNDLMNSLVELCFYLKKNHPINQRKIIGHSDIIPSRKFDPGRLFDWQYLAQYEIGIFPQTIDKSLIPEISTVQEMLCAYGYKINITNVLDELTIDVMRAFNEHFNPKCFDQWSEESQAKLEELLIIITK